MSKNTSKNMAALITALLMLTTASGCSSSKGNSDDASTTAEFSSVVSSTEAETSTVKLYSSPQSSTPIDEIPANVEVNVIDDSISGWLLVSLWNNNHISYGYVAADSISWRINN